MWSVGDDRDDREQTVSLLLVVVAVRQGNSVILHPKEAFFLRMSALVGLTLLRESAHFRFSLRVLSWSLGNMSSVGLFRSVSFGRVWSGLTVVLVSLGLGLLSIEGLGSGLVNVFLREPLETIRPRTVKGSWSVLQELEVLFHRLDFVEETKLLYGCLEPNVR